MTTLTPDQLPSANAQFIAYGSPERVADPLGGDEAISIRPQVFVRYYRGIKIKDLRTPNDDTVNVVFDPTSVGLEKEFGAYMNSDDRVVAYLREQFEAGNPLDVGIEYQRRKKTKNEKQGISPLPPIHALRGASNPDGTGNHGVMLGESGNNTHSKIALINGRRTTVIQSDPREWQGLVSNTQGDLPPAGWKALTDKEDWTRLGVITPRGDAALAQAPNAGQQAQENVAGQGLDMNVLSKIIGNEVRKGLKEYGENLLRQEDATRGTPTSQASASSVEGKPWMVWINKDQMNLGSFLVAGESYALRWAFAYLGALGDDVLNADTEIRWEAARELADASQKIADKVQSTAYNGEVRADRTSASFKEAVMWVRFHIENSYPFSPAEDFDYEAWFTNVGRSATATLKTSEGLAQAYLDERYPKVSKETAGEQNAQQTTAPSDDRAHMVSAYLQLLAQKWNDRDGVLALAREAKQKNLLGVQVWANPSDGKFSAEPFDGGQELSIGELTKNQFGLLSQAADAAPAEDQQASIADADEPAPEPAPAPEGQVQQSAEAPQTTPIQQSAQHIAAALSKAVTEDEVAEGYRTARDANLLTAEIAVKHGVGHFGLSPVRPGTEGAETMALGAVFDALRAAIDAPQQASAPPEAPAESESTPEPEDSQEALPAGSEQTDSEQKSEPEAASTPEEETPDTEPVKKSNSQAESPAMDIAERALAATSSEELKALVDEANQKGVSEEVVAIRAAKGSLSNFLTSRLKRAAKSGY